MTPVTFQALEDYLYAFGISFQDLDGFKPDFIVSMMAMMEKNGQEFIVKELMYILIDAQ